MPLETSILNIYGFEIEKVEGRNPVTLHVHYELPSKCPHCQGTRLRLKDTFSRLIRHESIGFRKTFLNLKTHKYLCKTCGKYFNQRIPGILPYKRSTEGFRYEVFQKHHDGICQTKLASRVEIGSATIERWYQDYLKRSIAEMKNNPCPRILGIDEHFFTKKKGYATTLCDLGKHRVHDVVLGRSEKALAAYFMRLKARDKVRVVVIDLADSYRSLIKKYFPCAKIVSDRFHVIRLINYHFLKLWQQIDPVGRKNKGLLSLMRRHKENLKTAQRVNLSRYLNEHPELKVIYDFKQNLCRLMLIKSRTKRECRRLIPIFIKYIEQLKSSLLEPFVTLGKTLESWSEEVVRMWRFTKSNGITEGFHTKMEMISRRAYGFRNFENYRLRVKALCS